MVPGINLYAKEKLPAEQVSADASAAEARQKVSSRADLALENEVSNSDSSTNLELPTQPPNSEQIKSPPKSSKLSEASLEQFDFPPNHHLWATFPIGSWREIEITTETFDESGRIYGRSVTTQKEVLKAIADDSYVLEIQATVDVSGKQIVGPVNTRILRLLTDQSGAVFSTTRAVDEMILVNDRPIMCQVWDVLYGEETRNLRDRVYYNSELFPYVIRRETFETAENQPVGSIATDSSFVIARHIPFAVGNKILPCVCEKTTRLREKGGIQSIRMISAEVPGGEVQNWSTDFNSDAQPNRWSVLKLLSYGVNSTEATPVESN